MILNFNDYRQQPADNDKSERVCRTSYTCNGWQPVVCTHIEDDPLFYFTEEESDIIEGALEDILDDEI